MTERWIIAGVIAATSLYALRGFWSERRGKSATDPYRAADWWPEAIVIVSHDRGFLRETVDEIVELGLDGGEATFYTGGWDAYSREREIAASAGRADYERATNERARVLAAADEQRRRAAANARRVNHRGNDTDKHVAVVGASTGLFGAVWAQAELRKVLTAIGARVVDEELPVGVAHEAFRPDGSLVDPRLQATLSGIVAELVHDAHAQAEADRSSAPPERLLLSP